MAQIKKGIFWRGGMNTQLREHQMLMLHMLQEVDTICKKFHINYMLFAGSALGAVRHQGFIPWDDDLDIVMLRKDYEKFLAVAPNELNQDEYFVQKEFSEHWPMFFTKLRKNGTACIERQLPKDRLMHQGIYIDIFPCDNLSNNPISRKLQFLASKVVIAKSVYMRGYITDSIVKKVFMQICRLLPQNPFWKFAIRRTDNQSKMVHTFFGGASRYENNIYPREWFQSAVPLLFETGYYPVSAYYDEMLTKLYGDYMTPLPEEKRGCKVHGEIVDLEKSYEEYWGVQENMNFSEYTRSIR